MPSSVQAIRGATTVDQDDPEQISSRVQELVEEVMSSNDLTPADMISVIFTATSDISSAYPATAARSLGLDDVPLLGAQELDVEGMLPRCIRLLAHVNTERPRSEINHIYLHDARRLRIDLVK